MRAYKITQEQLDEIYEHPLPDHAYQILANLPILSSKSTVQAEDPLPPVKSVQVHETAGMWGEPKEEPFLLDDDREPRVHQPKKRNPGLRGDFTFDKNAVYEIPEPMTDFFMQKISSYEPETPSFAEIVEREKQYKAAKLAEKERLKKRASSEYLRCEDLQRMINDLEARIFDKIDKGLTVNLSAQRLQLLKQEQKEAEAMYKAIMDELWGAPHESEEEEPINVYNRYD